MAPTPLADLGAGLTTSTKGKNGHPSGPPKHGPAGQMERAFTAASTFFSGVMAISATQFLGAPLKMIDPKFYEAYMAFTKQSFGVLITTMTQWWSPTVVRVSGDKSLPKQLFRREDGSLECKFPKRLVMMANHQLYTDWLYLWWIAYTNNMHGYIYIILKESLKSIPIVGWGCQFYNFIFLKRHWEHDQQTFKEHMDKLNNPQDPMWLLIFPEGTNLSKTTRAASKRWADKNGLQDMKHQLLPRSRGLQFALQSLRHTTEWLYDCTIAYEGIPPGQFGQDIFTLRSSMFEGRPPKSVNMHFRRFKLENIPIDDAKAFDSWLRNRWREKDYLLEHFVRFNSFPDDEMWMAKQLQKQRLATPRQGSQPHAPPTASLKPQPALHIETQIRSNNLEEFLSIFAPLTSIMMVLFLFYGGSNPNDLFKTIGEATQQMGGQASNLLGDGSPKLDLVRDDSSEAQPLKLRPAPRKATGPTRSALANLEAKHATPAAVQRNLVQKYVSAVRPAAGSAISLPDSALRVGIAKKPGPPALKFTPAAASKEAAERRAAQTKSADANVPTRLKAQAKKPRPRLAGRRLSIASTISPMSSVSARVQPTAPGSSSGALLQRSGAGSDMGSSTTVTAKPVNKKTPGGVGTKTVGKKPQPAKGAAQPLAQKKQDPANGPKVPLYKVDKATFDRIRTASAKKGQLPSNNAGEAAAPKAEVKTMGSRPIKVDQAVLNKWAKSSLKA